MVIESFEIENFGNVELDGSNLIFRLKGEKPEDQLRLFMATFVRKDATKTLNNIERAAKLCFPKRETISAFMRAVATVIPKIYEDLDKEEPETGAEKTLPNELLKAADAEAERILDSVDPLAEVNVHLQKLVCKEEKNAQKLFLKCVAVRTKDGRVKWIVVIMGTEGSGKTTLMSITKDLCRCKVVGRLTRHALDYMELQNYDILVLQEVGHLDKEDQGLSTIKFLSIDDDGYTVEVPIRDPDTGEMTTKTYKIPPINVLSSSTRVQFDPQFERRAEFINPDETELQTEAVREFKAELERQSIDVDLGRVQWTDRDYAKAVLRAVLSKLKDYRVEIPFPSELGRVIKGKQLRTRGDVDKLYANVRLYHLLIQRSQEPVVTSAGDVIFASPGGAVRVIELFRESFESMISGIDKRTKHVIEVMVKLGYGPKKKISMRERMELAKETKRAPNTIYRFLERMYEKQLLAKGKEGEGKGAPVFYELTMDPKEMVDSPLLAPQEIQNDLYHEMFGTGIDFLKSRFDIEVVHKIRGGWRKSIRSKSESNIQTPSAEDASAKAVIQFRRMWRSVEAEIEPKQRETFTADAFADPPSAVDKEKERPVD